MNALLGAGGRDLALFVAAFAVFTPYMVPALGIRGEQLVAYPVFAVVLVGSRMTQREWQLTSALPLAWASLIPIGLIGSLYMMLHPLYQLSWSSVAATADSILLGAVLAWTAAAVVAQSRDPLGTFRGLALVVVAMVSLNGVVAIVSTFVDTAPWLASFWTSNEPGSTSVALRSLAGDRYSGIFNQPYEAGLAHSVALLLWCYLFVQGRTRAGWLLLFPVPLLVGGLLPVSKVFMLGGLPLGLGYLVWNFKSRGVGRRTILVLGGTVATAVVVFTLLPDVVRPGERFAYLFGDDVISRLSGGRYAVGAEGGLDHLFARLGGSPIVGFGLDPQIGPFDNAVLAQLILGGVLGLLPLGVVVWLLVRGVVAGLRHGASADVRVHAALVALFLGSMAGAHPLLVNRSGSLLLIALGGLSGLLLHPPMPERPVALHPVADVASQVAKWHRG